MTTCRLSTISFFSLILIGSIFDFMIGFWPEGGLGDWRCWMAGGLYGWEGACPCTASVSGVFGVYYWLLLAEYILSSRTVWTT
jgi:hypothetical protein